MQVISHASQARGYAKTTSKPYFMSAYKIDNNSKCETRDCVKQLLEGARFIYKVIPYLYVIVLSLIIYGQDPALKTGIFRAPLLQILINKIWFKNKEQP